ncbi:unnamed protein product [Plutella xylostella]|uniref:PAN2-PAN3 deadenylation complex subunit PAN3 n=1 Tax=Plutella xylostella TaxID=51655 RepID=A0A8S4GEB7_PLUXY|nr:PAN2-PAN3 deadenylation complex subunit PAN3 [Plutella xylostella]CAG9138211.1 unnamed protein product [Plutella xylostella]
MDPSIFLPYSPPNGLPQESKLATYMNRSTSTPTRALGQTLAKLGLEDSPTFTKKILIGDFVPMNYFGPPSVMPESPENSPPNTMMIPPSTPQVHQENVGGTTYFYSSDSMNSSAGLNASAGQTSSFAMGGDECLAGGVPSPYATQMYQPTPPPMHLTAKPGLAASFYMPDTIRAEVYQRNEDVFLTTDLRQYPDLPEAVEMYAELTPLESAAPHALATSFRATHRRSAEHYALRRLHNHSGAVSKRLEVWKKIDHPNVVKLHEIFSTKAFNDHSLVLVYDYHPGSVSVQQKYLGGGGGAAGGDTYDPFSNDPDAPRPYTHQKNAMLRAVAHGALLPEAELWSLLVQLTAALRAIHHAGLACRSLEASKVVVSGCRVRVAWAGAADASPAPHSDIGQAQQEDLRALGRLALSLCVRSPTCDLPAAMERVARTYSADLKNLILYLLSTSPARRSVTDLMPMIGARFYTQVEALQRRADVIETQLAREADNGRLLRILLKLGAVNERPELNMDASWSETGDRYMLKLFRDYLFHSVTADGRPWLDQAHLAHCLNQLDAGSPNLVELMSRDEQSVLVVSYAELKHCLDAAFEELMLAAPPS